MLKLNLATLSTFFALNAISLTYAADPVSPREIRSDKKEIVQDRRDFRRDLGQAKRARH